MQDSISMENILDSSSEYNNSLIFDPFNPFPIPPGFIYTSEENEIDLISQNKNQNLNNSQKSKKINEIKNTQSYKDSNFSNFEAHLNKPDGNAQEEYNVEVRGEKNEKDYKEIFYENGMKAKILSSTKSNSKENNQNQSGNKEYFEVIQNENNNSNSIDEKINKEETWIKKPKKQIFGLITPIHNIIKYKRFNGKKHLKSLILKYALKRLRELISKIFKYLLKHDKKKNQILGASKNISQKVSAKDDEMIWNMEYRNILIYGMDNKTKNPQYKNYLNIKMII